MSKISIMDKDVKESVNKLPFSVNRSRIDIAIAEADELLEDPSTKRYNNMKDLQRDLLA